VQGSSKTWTPGWLTAAAALAVSLLAGAVPALAADTWIVTGSLGSGDLVHTGILLQDDTVLALTGDPTRPESSELYDPATGTWLGIGPSGVNGRAGHAAVLLRNGLVLVTGGDADGSGPSKLCRLYDPTSRAWRDAGSLNVPRMGHTATLLEDGRVLAVGGAGRHRRAHEDGGAVRSRLGHLGPDGLARGRP